MHLVDIVNVRQWSHGDVQKPKVIHDYNPNMRGEEKGGRGGQKQWNDWKLLLH